MNKKLILISALLFIVGCERETTFVCVKLIEITVSKDKSHITSSVVGSNLKQVFWKSLEFHQNNEIFYSYVSDQRSFRYNTKEKTLTISSGGGFITRTETDCPRKQESSR